MTKLLKTPDLIEAIHSLRPTSQFILRGNAIDTYELDWKDETTIKPTKSELENEIAKLQTDYDAQEYARKRKAEYPTIEELVVALYDTDDKSAIEAKRAEVKAKYPKP